MLNEECPASWPRRGGRLGRSCACRMVRCRGGRRVGQTAWRMPSGPPSSRGGRCLLDGPPSRRVKGSASRVLYVAAVEEGACGGIGIVVAGGEVATYPPEVPGAQSVSGFGAVRRGDRAGPPAAVQAGASVGVASAPVRRPVRSVWLFVIDAG